MKREFYVTEDQAGRRIDRLLRTRYAGVPLGAIMKALRDGSVRLDGKKAAPDTRLQAGQFLQVPWDDDICQAPPAGARTGQKPPLDTIYRDDYVWIVNKPAGLLTQPDVRGGDSLITRALSELRWDRVDFRPATVQRLDRNTSGVVLIAVSGKSQRFLSELIRERRIRKIYWAAVRGEMPESGRVDLPLLKDPDANVVTVSEKGQAALTIYRKIRSLGAASLAELELVTGRPHQARAHMSAIGHPILGDAKYGGAAKGIRRPLLHARSVTFPDDKALPPGISGKTFFADLPGDMREFCAAP